MGDLHGASQRGGAEAIYGRCGDRVGKAGRKRRPAGYVAHSLVGGIHAAGGDVLDAIELDAYPLAGPDHGLTEQVVRANV